MPLTPLEQFQIIKFLPLISASLGLSVTNLLVIKILTFVFFMCIVCYKLLKKKHNRVSLKLRIRQNFFKVLSFFSLYIFILLLGFNNSPVFRIITKVFHTERTELECFRSWFKSDKVETKVVHEYYDLCYKSSHEQTQVHHQTLIEPGAPDLYTVFGGSFITVLFIIISTIAFKRVLCEEAVFFSKGDRFVQDFDKFDALAARCYHQKVGSRFHDFVESRDFFRFYNTIHQCYVEEGVENFENFRGLAAYRYVYTDEDDIKYPLPYFKKEITNYVTFESDKVRKISHVGELGFNPDGSIEGNDNLINVFGMTGTCWQFGLYFTGAFIAVAAVVFAYKWWEIPLEDQLALGRFPVNHRYGLPDNFPFPFFYDDVQWFLFFLAQYVLIFMEVMNDMDAQHRYNMKELARENAQKALVKYADECNLCYYDGATQVSQQILIEQPEPYTVFGVCTWVAVFFIHVVLIRKTFCQKVVNGYFIGLKENKFAKDLDNFDSLVARCYDQEVGRDFHEYVKANDFFGFYNTIHQCYVKEGVENFENFQGLAAQSYGYSVENDGRAVLLVSDKDSDPTAFYDKFFEDLEASGAFDDNINWGGFLKYFDKGDEGRFRTDFFRRCAIDSIQRHDILMEETKRAMDILVGMYMHGSDFIKYYNYFPSFDESIGFTAIIKTFNENIVISMIFEYPFLFVMVQNDSLFIDEYLSILVYFLIATLLSYAILGFSFGLVLQKPEIEKTSGYECGFENYEDARQKFNVRFYLLAILFILFDIEAMFLIPWCVTLSLINYIGYLVMMEFISELFLGFFYVWYIGGLDWEQ